MMSVRLFRKRLIPMECVELKQDEILYMDEDRIITRWNTLKPRKDFSHGVSCYFLKKGYKVSKFIAEDGTLRYWYCDIIKTEYQSWDNSFLFTDLLADVILFPDGKIRVVDLEELADAVEEGLLTYGELLQSLRQLDELLKLIYSGNFSKIQDMVNEQER